MAGQRGLYGDLRGIEIAHFADHDDVGIVPQEGAQNTGKSQVYLRLHLNLVDAIQLIFDRILDSEDLPLRSIETHQARVKRRRLSAARRTSNQQDSLRLVEKAEIAFE